MKEMFKAKIDSPVTSLSGAINSIDTIIYIDDVTALPEAPNIVTIWDDKYTETIKYTGKAQNSLTGCTRGFNGQARNWDKGKAIARLLTAYDIDTFKDNLEEVNNNFSSHLADDANPNLLINSDFRNLINQRGLSSYTPSYGYSIDRWYSNDTKVDVGVGKITLTRTGSTNHFFNQRIENANLLVGKTVNLSAKVNGVICSGSGLFPTEGSGHIVDVYSDSIVVLSLYNYSSTDRGIAIKLQTQGASIDIEYAKLEIGSRATPFSPRLYAEELALCQRYCLIVNDSIPLYNSFGFTGIVMSSTSITATLPIPVSMRVKPSLNLDASKFQINIFSPDTHATPSNVSVLFKTNETIVFTFTGTSLPLGAIVDIRINISTNMILDAEIY